MATEKRIYMVDGTRLVRAANAAQALRHVVRDVHTVVVARQDDLVALFKKGVDVEETGSAE